MTQEELTQDECEGGGGVSPLQSERLEQAESKGEMR